MWLENIDLVYMVYMKNNARGIFEDGIIISLLILLLVNAIFYTTRL